MRVLKFLFFSFSILLVGSCSFNKLFLHPSKLNPDTKSLTFKQGADSTIVNFMPPNFQPIPLKNGVDTIRFDYSIESVTYKSANGHILNGWLLKSKNVPPTITILHLHGNAGNLLSQFKAIAPLTKYGFQIFMFDYSGFGFSEGKATKKNVLTDALSSLDYLKTRKEIINTKLIIYGQSLGGHLAAVVAAKRQSEVDELVIEGAFSSHKDVANDRVPVLGRLFTKQSYRATKSIKDFNKPVLVIHSTEDKTVPFFMGQKIYEAANSPKEFYEINKCHICGPIYYTEEIAGKIQSMLKTPH